MRNIMKPFNKNSFLSKILIVLIPFLFINASYNSSTPEGYAKELVKVLQKGDVKVFKKFYPTCEELRSSILKSISDSTRKIRFNKEYTEDKCQDELNKNYIRFEEVINSGKQLGIIWKKIKYVNAEYEIKSGDFGILSIYKTKIIFSFNDVVYYVEVKGLGKLINGWNGGKIYGPHIIK
jgi:hypothetical protein